MSPISSMPRTVLALAATVLIAGCGGGDLDTDDVTNLPAGDGQGTAASGTYSVRFDTTSCVGRCQSPVVICRDGEGSNGQMTAVQRDGSFTVVAIGGTLTGGIDRDGSFTVGALIPFRGLDAAARWDGQSSSNSLTGSMELHVTGTVEGQDVDCTTSADVTATRL